MSPHDRKKTGLALERDPEEPRSWRQRDNVSLAKEQHELAEQDFTKAIRVDPQSARAWANRGVTRHRRGTETLAAEDLQPAQTLDDGIVVPDLVFLKTRRPRSQPPLRCFKALIDAAKQERE